MFFHCILLAFCSTLDSLGIGITYGLKNTHILFGAKIILFLSSFLVTILSLLFGDCLAYFLPDSITNVLGSIVLILIGSFMIFSCFKKEKVKTNINESKTDTQKVYKFFIRFLGITIQIIRDPTNSDFDNSNNIDSKEALFLGIALSLDTIGIGISSSMLEINYFFLPLLVAIFELFFLSFGSFLGRRIKNISNIPENIWSILAGFLLIFIGITKFIL